MMQWQQRRSEVEKPFGEEHVRIGWGCIGVREPLMGKAGCGIWIGRNGTREKTRILTAFKVILRVSSRKNGPKEAAVSRSNGDWGLHR